MLCDEIVVFYQCFCLSVVTNLLILYVHVGTTGRYHNESLDSLTIILLYGSFLKIVISIYSLIIVSVRLVMFIKRICYKLNTQTRLVDKIVCIDYVYIMPA